MVRSSGRLPPRTVSTVSLGGSPSSETGYAGCSVCLPPCSLLGWVATAPVTVTGRIGRRAGPRPRRDRTSFPGGEMESDRRTGARSAIRRAICRVGKAVEAHGPVVQPVDVLRASLAPGVGRRAECVEGRFASRVAVLDG